MKLISAAENSVNELDKARSVLYEACEYFIRIDEVNDLPRMSTHIVQLLYVVDDILTKAEGGMTEVIEECYKSRKQRG